MKFNTAKLKNILAERNLSQVDLQKLTKRKFPPDGVSLSSIRQIACGNKSGIYVAWKLASALDLPLDFFTTTNGRKSA